MRTQQEKDLIRSSQVVTQAQARSFVNRATYSRINERRGDLIHKKYAPGMGGDGLDEAEQIEYAKLDAEVERLIALVCRSRRRPNSRRS